MTNRIITKNKITRINAEKTGKFPPEMFLESNKNQPYRIGLNFTKWVLAVRTNHLKDNFDGGYI